MTTLAAFLGVSGLTDVGYAFYDDTETIIGSRTQSGVQDASSGWYSVSVEIPSTAKSIRWNSTSDTSAAAREYLTITETSDEVFTETDRLMLSGLDVRLSESRVAILESIAAPSGAYTVTFNVVEYGTTDDISNAILRITQGIDTFVGTSDLSGNVSFSLDSGVYSCTVTKSGYTHSPEDVTITGDATVSISLTPSVTPSEPTDPSLCRVYGYLVLPNGAVASGVQLTFELQSGNAVKSQKVLANHKHTVRTNKEGYFSTDLVRNDTMTPSGTTWRITCTSAELDAHVSIESSTLDIADLIS